MSTAGMHRKSISSVSSGFLSIGTPHGGPNAVREYPGVCSDVCLLCMHAYTSGSLNIMVVYWLTTCNIS